MKVLLTTYAGPRRFFDMLLPDPGIAQLAGTLRGHGTTPMVYDLNLPGNSPAGLLRLIEKEKPDVFGMKFFDTGYPGSVELAAEVKRTYPACRVIAGGPHPSLFREHILHQTHVFDAVAVGEGEQTLPSIVEWVDGRRPKEDVPNIIYRQGEEIVCTDVSLTAHLDSLALPDYSVLDLERYFPLIILNTRRGCPHNCAFCAHNFVWGYAPDSGRDCVPRPLVRQKSLGRVMGEIAMAQRDLGVSLFGFADSTLPAELIVELSEQQASQGQRILWAAFGMVGQFSADELQLLARAGCVSLWIGVESGNETMLRRMGKPYRRSDVLRTFHDARAAGIRAIPGFVVGFPGEDEDSLADSLALVSDLEADVRVISPFILDPGSPVAQDPKRYGVAVDDDWECKIVGRGYRNEFDIAYYTVNGIPNDVYWRRFRDLCGYAGWDQDRSIAESEYATVLSRAVGLDHDAFLREVCSALLADDAKRLSGLLLRAWNAASSLT